MALHDFVCLTCGTEQRDVYVSIAIGARAADIRCACGARCEWVPFPTAVNAYDVRGFDTTVRQPDGTEKLVHVGSLADIRRIERETEIAARNGEGQAMRWRDYSQDASNGHVNTFGDSPAQQLRRSLLEDRRRAAAERGRATPAPVTVRRGAPVTADHGTAVPE